MILEMLLAAVFPSAPVVTLTENPNDRAVIGGTPSGGMPPVRFRLPGTAMITFGDQEAVEMWCGRAEAPRRMIACHHKVANLSVIMLPLPCAFADTEYYARVVCHEMAHGAGWTGFHEE